ncbi:MAG: MFS transporter [Candidatus Binatia bacterium]
MGHSEATRESAYGWVVVAAGMLITLVIYGIVASLAVFFKPLLQSFQWSRGQTSLIWAGNWVTFGVLSLLIGPLTDRFGARRTMLVGGSLFSLGILFSSQATSLWHLFLPFGMLGAVGRAAMWTPLAATVMSGFYAMAGVGMALGGLLGGILYDAIDSYQLSFVISLIAGVGAALIATTLQPPTGSSLREHKGIEDLAPA